MNNIIVLFLSFILISCSKYETKWKEVKGVGIPEYENLNYAIYFQDSLKGIIGGYKSIYNKNSNKPNNIPVLYLTKNGGKEWTPINFNNLRIEEYQNIVTNVKLADNFIICQIGSVIVESNDLGLTWNLIENSKTKDISKKYFSNSNQCQIQNKKFEFGNKKYIVKEIYKYENIEVIICYGSVN